MTDRQPENGSSAIDINVLENLARDAGTEAMSALIASFTRDCEKRELEIAAAVESEDLALLEAESHALAGAAQTFGALILATLTRAIEEACRQGRSKDAFSHAATLPGAASAARHAIAVESRRYVV